MVLATQTLILITSWTYLWMQSLELYRPYRSRSIYWIRTTNPPWMSMVSLTYNRHCHPPTFLYLLSSLTPLSHMEILPRPLPRSPVHWLHYVWTHALVLPTCGSLEALRQHHRVAEPHRCDKKHHANLEGFWCHVVQGLPSNVKWSRQAMVLFSASSLSRGFLRTHREVPLSLHCKPSLPKNSIKPI